MRELTASDRNALIKLASSMPKGDETRKAILAGLMNLGQPKNIASTARVEHSTVTGYAKIMGRARVTETQVGVRAKISDRAVVHRCNVSDDAKIGGEAHVENAFVWGKANIGGTAKIVGGSWNGKEGPVMEGTWKAPGVPA